MLKTVALFKSSAFSLAWPKEENPDEADPWGKDLILFLAGRLAQKGVKVLTPEPVTGEGGWYIDVEVNGTAFTPSVNWFAMGVPARDYWVIQIRPRWSLLGSILRKRVPGKDYEALMSAIDKILKDDDRIDDIRWLSDEEFAAVG